jgi:Tol biopolymer transport system component
MRTILASFLLWLPALVSCGPPPPEADTLTSDPREVHLRNVRQLTFSGENAEAYWSADASRLIFQAHEGNDACDQIYTMNAEGGDVRRVSSGGGRTTCAYFFPDGERIVYSSTRHLGEACPEEPDMSRGYVWGLYDYDIYAERADGSDVTRLTESPGYDAEATVSTDGSKIVFTSVRDGDLEIYTMNPDGTGVTRLTHEPGYDGGPFFSADGKRIVYRAHHPTDPAELEDYRALLADGLIRPGRLEIWIMNADGTDKRRLTDNGAANFAPFFHPDGRSVIFASNQHDPGSRNFDLYRIGVDGTGLERVTWHQAFDSFPMFSPDGTRLVWASNRFQAKPGDTNLFVADWVE